MRVAHMVMVEHLGDRFRIIPMVVTRDIPWWRGLAPLPDVPSGDPDALTAALEAARLASGPRDDTPDSPAGPGTGVPDTVWHIDWMRDGSVQVVRQTRTTEESLTAPPPVDVVRLAQHLVPSGGGSANGFRPTDFGYKMAWWAVRTTDPGAVVDALGLTSVRPGGWDDGVGAAYGDTEVFVAPPLEGWVLAVGWPLFFVEPPDVVAASARLDTEVQAFLTHRVSETHGWTRADRGRLVRTYSYSGDTGESSAAGEPDPLEHELDLVQSADDEDGEYPDEATVMTIAGAWSLNPTRLSWIPDPIGVGTIGTLRR